MANKRAAPQSLNVDPTRTTTIRNQFVKDINRRFGRLKQLIEKAVVEQDVFGLGDGNPIVGNLRNGEFAFRQDADKVPAFMDWLRAEEENGILEVINTGPGGEEPWSNVYIRSAYQKGISRAIAEKKKAGFDYPDFDAEAMADPIATAFFQPIHARTVAMAYTRAFSELKGVTEAMNQQLSRTLAEGLAEGRNPEYIARRMKERVDNITRTRARMIARTETIRAHHMANVAVYEQAGLNDIEVLVEWRAGRAGVCPDCASLNGKIYTLEAIKPLLPLHPNCRCVAIPAKVGERPDERGRYDETAIADEYIRKDGTIRPLTERAKRAAKKAVKGERRPPAMRRGDSGKTTKKAEKKRRQVKPRAPRISFDSRINESTGLVTSSEFIGTTKAEVEDVINAATTPSLTALVNKLRLPNKIEHKGAKGQYQRSWNGSESHLYANPKEHGGFVARHEFGHHIDYEANILLNNNKFVSISETDRGFIIAFDNDRKNLGLHRSATNREVMKKFRDKYMSPLEKGKGQYSYTVYRGKTDNHHGMSDIVDAMTQGVFQQEFAAFGRGRSYYKKKSARLHEVFANLFAMRGTPAWDDVKEVFPNLAREFDNIIERGAVWESK